MDFVSFAIADINAFWVNTFQAWQWNYGPPRVFPYAGAINSMCGVVNAGPGFYCPADGTIYYDTIVQASLMQTFGDFAWVSVLAHEWAHHVQFLLGKRRDLALYQPRQPFPIHLELQADCLSGCYSSNAAYRGLLDQNDAQEAFRCVAAHGDNLGLAWFDPRAHGQSAQRMSAFLDGYHNGVARCLTYA